MWIYIPQATPMPSPSSCDSAERKQATITRLELGATMRGEFANKRSWSLASKRKEWLARFVDRIPDEQAAESAVAAWIEHLPASSPHAGAPIVPMINPNVGSKGILKSGHPQESYEEFETRIKRESRARMKKLQTRCSGKAGSFWGTPRVGGGYAGNVRRPIKSRLEQQVAHWDVAKEEELGLPPERRRPREATRKLNHHFVEWLMGWPRGWANAHGKITAAEFEAWERAMSATANAALCALYSS
jgi:hypothetical protein